MQRVSRIHLDLYGATGLPHLQGPVCHARNVRSVQLTTRLADVTCHQCARTQLYRRLARVLELQAVVRENTTDKLEALERERYGGAA